MCHSFEHWSRREANLIMHRLKSIFVVAFLLWISFAAAHAQSTEQSSPGSQTPELSVRSNLVLVPALVKTEMGNPATHRPKVNVFQAWRMQASGG